MKLFTIGFARKTAEQFFSLLIRAEVRNVIDIRLNNASQLAGFTKRDDLPYFLKTIGGIGYLHEPRLAPTREILDAYRKNGGNWAEYEQAFKALLNKRKPEEIIVSKDRLRYSCLLCSEPSPEQCHRRLVAEYLKSRWQGFEIIHL